MSAQAELPEYSSDFPESFAAASTTPKFEAAGGVTASNVKNPEGAEVIANSKDFGGTLTS
jgi:hypothetical protein